MTDLFTQQESLSRVKSLLGSWGDILSSKVIENLAEILVKVNFHSQTNIVYPPKDKILRIFRNLELKDIKVVIIGQDPYHDSNANGYAFACEHTVSPSLRQIVQAIKEDVKSRQLEESNKSLEYLVEQGVFLLNTHLTTGEQPLSHRFMNWQRFTGEVIRTISQSNQRVVWMLWGKEAQSMVKYINDTNKQLILLDSHPVSSSYSNTNWICNHFSKANEFLINNNLIPIKWI